MVHAFHAASGVCSDRCRFSANGDPQMGQKVKTRSSFEEIGFCALGGTRTPNLMTRGE